MKILVAEDDLMVQEMLVTVLTDLGHVVQAVDNGDKLIKLALEAKPDLILTDMHMPQMRGDSMIAMLEMYEPLAGVPVIMITGASAGEIADAGLPEGITVIPKPLDLAKLSAEVQKAAARLGK